MLVVCSDIHVLGPVTNERRSHQNAGYIIASEFSKIFRGWHSRTPQREGATPSRTHPQPGLWSDTGRKRLGVGTQTLVPLNFSDVVAVAALVHRDQQHYIRCENSLMSSVMWDGLQTTKTSSWYKPGRRRRCCDRRCAAVLGSRSSTRPAARSPALPAARWPGTTCSWPTERGPLRRIRCASSSTGSFSSCETTPTTTTRPRPTTTRTGTEARSVVKYGGRVAGSGSVRSSHQAFPGAKKN